MHFLTRRTFCLQFCAAFIAPPIFPEKKPSAALLYGQGVRMLREGRTFEKAAAHFVRASEMEPTNAEYQIALGCAYACRVASLSWAGIFADRLAREKAAYPKVMTMIDEIVPQSRRQMQEENASEAEVTRYNTELAELKEKLKANVNRIIVIKDDKKPFCLTQVELANELTALTKNALAAWESGVNLCQSMTDKANAEYVRGWGMNLIFFYCDPAMQWRKNVFSGMMADTLHNDVYDEKVDDPFKTVNPPFDIKGLPNKVQIKAAYQAACDLAPGNALYVQAQADFMAFGEIINPGAEATELYRRAASLDPKNANLWNRVYDRETANRYQEKQPDGASAVDDLHRAQARDKANAWYGYEEAGRIIKPSAWSREADLPYDANEKAKEAARAAPRTDAGYKAAKQAVALMERANTLPRFAPPVYQNSVPVLLTQAWNYVPRRWYESPDDAFEARFRALGRACGGYAESLSDKKQFSEALRVVRAVQAMAMRLVGDPWPTGRGANGKMSVGDTGTTRALVGTFIVSIAYSSLIRSAEKTGDSEKLTAATREKDAWRARVKKWIGTLPNDEDEPTIYAVYDRN